MALGFFVCVLAAIATSEPVETETILSSYVFNASSFTFTVRVKCVPSASPPTFGTITFIKNNIQIISDNNPVTIDNNGMARLTVIIEELSDVYAEYNSGDESAFISSKSNTVTITATNVLCPSSECFKDIENGQIYTRIFDCLNGPYNGSEFSIDDDQKVDDFSKMATRFLFLSPTIGVPLQTGNPGTYPYESLPDDMQQKIFDVPSNCELPYDGLLFTNCGEPKSKAGLIMLGSSEEIDLTTVKFCIFDQTAISVYLNFAPTHIIFKDFTTTEVYITLTATVQSITSDTSIPGTISFFQNGERLKNYMTDETEVSLINGIGNFPVYLHAGALYNITARYNGYRDEISHLNLGPSEMLATVNVKAETTTQFKFVQNSYNDSQDINLTLQVLPLFDGNSSLSLSINNEHIETKQVNGDLFPEALIIFNLGSKPIGDYTVRADYNGIDTVGANSSQELSFNVNNDPPPTPTPEPVPTPTPGPPLAPTKTVLTRTSSTTPQPIVGASISFRSVTTKQDSTAGTMTGKLNFRTGNLSTNLVNIIVGTPANLPSNGIVTLTTSTILAGTTYIESYYEGNNIFNESYSNILSVIIAKGTTSVALTLSATNAYYGSSVTFTATTSILTGSKVKPTGRVIFYKRNSLDIIGYGDIVPSTGIATYNFTGLPVGLQSITAKYEGDSNFHASSISTKKEITIGNEAPTKVTVQSTPNPAEFSETILITINVNENPISNIKPTGQVNISNGTIHLKTVQLINGKATYTFKQTRVTDVVYDFHIKYIPDSILWLKSETLLKQKIRRMVPRFEKFTTKLSSQLNTSKITHTYSAGADPQFVAYIFLGNLANFAYSFAPSKTKTTYTRIQATATVTISIHPVWNGPILLYAVKWPPGTYTFQQPTEIKSKSVYNSKITSKTVLTVPPGPGSTFSGILYFAPNITSIEWSGVSKSSIKILGYTLAIGGGSRSPS